MLSYIESGKLRALGVTTRNRSPRIPDVPAVAEALPCFDVALWNGVFAPASTSPAVVDNLAAAIRKVSQDPAFRKTLADQGSTLVGSTPAIKNTGDRTPGVNRAPSRMRMPSVASATRSARRGRTEP